MQEQSTLGLLKAGRIHHKMPPMTSPLGKIIKGRLGDLGETQEWLAEQLGVSKNAVSKWIKTGQISRENAIAAARVLRLTSDQLLLGEVLTDVSSTNETTLERLDADEKRILDLYRAATKDGKMMIYGAASVAPKDGALSVRRPH
jgi:transcriptional regulator with XRE-family HTH domain